MADHPSPSDPKYWGNDYRPPGGFVNYIQNPQQPMSQNSHFVDATLRYTPLSTPQTNTSKGSPSLIDVHNKDDDVECRIEKRLNWTLEEDERLMSAWLNNSTDPIMDNNKKNDQYWKDVLKSYNMNTPQVGIENRSKQKIVGID